MRYSRHIAIAVGMLLLAICLTGLPGVRVAPAMEKAEDSADDTMILLETFMVEVPLSDLYRLNVPPVSEGTRSVSVKEILACLNTPNSAAVTAGAKLVVRPQLKATTQATTQQGYYVGLEEERDMEFLDSGVSFTALAATTPGGKISATIDFSYSNMDQGKELPTIANKEWSCLVLLEPGKPTLVGSTQDKETATFLVATANIMK